MKTIYVKLLFVLTLIALIGSLKYQVKLIDFVLHNPITRNDIVKVKMNKEILEIPIEEYLVGVIAGEMPASFELEALKAQAVASRTFVLSRHLNVDNTTSTQVYLTDEQMKKNWGNQYQKNLQKIKQAVLETKDEVMTYHDQYISALFFSSSAGMTNDCDDYFNGEVAYLKSVDSQWDSSTDPHFQRTKEFSKQELSKIFQTKSPEIKITSYSKSGYVKEVIVNNRKYTGREIRELLSLASSSFKIETTSTSYRFKTYGSGHGVGMSQYGAEGMAKEGKNYRDILKHYYQNIEIQRIDS